MNEKIRFRTKFSVDDYVRVLTFMRSQLFIIKHLSVIFSAITFLAVFVTIYQSANDNISVSRMEIFFFGIVSAIIVGTLVYLMNKFFSPLILKRTIAKQYESSPAMQEEKDVLISDQGIESSSELASGTIKWEAIIKGVESKTDFIFYTTSKFGHFIPKRVFSTEADVNSLRCLSRGKLGDKAKF